LRTPENFALCEVRPKAARLWKLDRFLKKSSAKTFADGFINKLTAHKTMCAVFLVFSN